MQAAKFASKNRIIVHRHIPILPSWKDYKPKKNQQDGEKTEDHLRNYMEKLTVCICPLMYYHSSLHSFFIHFFYNCLVVGEIRH
jgi:poly-beta-hydroxyalkanoate depolymerase